MRTALLAAAVLAAAAAAPAAHAAPMEITGHPCRWEGVARDTDPNEWTYLLFATPQKLSHVADTSVVAGSLRCTLKIGPNESFHDDPAVASTVSPVTPLVAVAPPTLAKVHVEESWWIPSVCAQVDLEGGGTYYWDDSAERWTTDPHTICVDYTLPAAMIRTGTPLDRRLLWPILDEGFGVVNGASDMVNGGVNGAEDLVNGVFVDHVDPTLCPLLGGLAPGTESLTVDPTGDVSVAGVLVWDCPPYLPPS